MIVGYARKQPSELFPINVDFSNDLTGTGETISSISVSVRNPDTGDDTSATILQGPAVINADQRSVSQTIKSGSDGERHIIRFLAQTNLSNVYEAEVKLTVIED